MDCWICGAPANSGEHKIKQSDLRSVLRKPSQAHPVYYHDKSTKNRPLGGYDRKFLKSSTFLCAKCNNEVTQPYDRAWETLSEALRTLKPPLKPGDLVRVNRIFPHETREKMRFVQLFFTKLSGCHLMAGNLKFDQASLSDSILRGQVNPYIYLKFGTSTENLIGMTDLPVAKFVTDDSCAFAVWFYCIGTLAVQVMYAVKGENRDGLINAWHPSLGTTRLLIADFS